MSQLYSMTVVVKEFDPEKKSAIINAANEKWEFEDWGCTTYGLSACGDGNLCAGLSEDEFARLLTLAIWKANGAYCSVSVNCTNLEYVPSDDYELSKDDYLLALENKQL